MYTILGPRKALHIWFWPRVCVWEWWGVLGNENGMSQLQTTDSKYFTQSLKLLLYNSNNILCNCL